jgi:hypothetical protein
MVYHEEYREVASSHSCGFRLQLPERVMATKVNMKDLEGRLVGRNSCGRSRQSRWGSERFVDRSGRMGYDL